MQELDMGMKCIKYMIFVANFMFVMVGFLLISIGSTIKAIYGDFDLFMEYHYVSPATLAVAIGIIIFFVAIFGCIGALKESTCLINMFAVLLMMILILEIAASIAAYVVRSDLSSSIKEKMLSTIDDYYNGTTALDAWDFTQSRLECCGVNGPTDWPRNNSYPDGTWSGPPSCCENWGVVDIDTCNTTAIWQTGCLDSLVSIVSEMSLLLGCGALAVALIQLLGVIFAFMLAKAVRRLKTQRLIETQQNRQRLYEQLARGTDDKPTPVLYTPASSDA